MTVPKTLGRLLVASMMLLSGCTLAGGGGQDATGSPLADYLHTAPSLDFYTGSPSVLAAVIESQRSLEQSIVLCMREQGFEYIPVEPGAGDSFMAYDESDIGSQDWVERYGFGVSTLWLEQGSLPADLVGYEVPTKGGPVDPNLEIFSSMSKSEQTAYEEALYGNVRVALTEDEDNTPPAQRPDTSEGCAEKYRYQDTYDLLATEFPDELQDLEAAISSDERLVAADNAIIACVRDKGYEYSGVENARVGFEKAVEKVQPVQGTDETLDGESVILLRELQRQEVDLAVATLRCGADEPSYRQLRADVRAEYEHRFLEANRSALKPFQADS